MASDLFGELDLHLIGEGRHRRLWHRLGAHVIERDGESGVRFAVWAPNARSVGVAGDWNGWDAGKDPLALQGKSGVWATFVPGVAAGAHYKFEIEGADGSRRLRADPMARRTEAPPSNASIVDESHYEWADSEWVTARAQADPVRKPLRIYEAHLGSWRTGLGYRELGEQLGAYAADLGFTHVELLPVAEHPFAPSWGYQVTGYFAPTARFGTPDDFRYFVDTLHRHGVGVIVDWVPAHFPKDDWALGRFDGTALYEHLDPRQGEHPDWGTFVFNYGRNEVRNFLIANALYWLEEFHIDGLRVDAVASMLYLDYSRQPGEWVPNELGGRENLAAISFLRELNTVVFGEHPGVMMIAEESTAWPQVSHPVDHGGLGFSHKWNMGGCTTPSPTSSTIRCIVAGITATSRSACCTRSRRTSCCRSVTTRWCTAKDRCCRRCRATSGSASPGCGRCSVGCGRIPAASSSSRAASSGSGASGTRNAASTGAPEGERHAGLLELVKALNREHGKLNALWERDHEPTGFQWLDADDAVHSTYGFLRWSADGRQVVACLANFTPMPRDGYRVGLPWGGEWRVVVDTNATYFGGTGYGGTHAVWAADEPHQNQRASAFLTLPPMAVVWLASEAPA